MPSLAVATSNGGSAVEASMQERPERGCEKRATSLLRRKAYVDVAREAFFSRGYSATTMSSIAAEVGGSKTTLWTYFSSKKNLFAAVVDEILEQHAKALSTDLPLDGDVKEILEAFAEVLIATLRSRPMIDLYRLVVAEAPRFPHLARLFFEKGPQRGRARLAAYFDIQMDRGAVRRGDPHLAAKQFAALCQAGTFQFALLELTESCKPVESRVEAAGVVAYFLGGWSHDS